ncbi:MAG: hypothetical protein IT178_19050 [Acidobacteria bacterium]|nr:hypothetical protein [Acidobacteriota bacterium]
MRRSTVSTLIGAALLTASVAAAQDRQAGTPAAPQAPTQPATATPAPPRTSSSGPPVALEVQLVIARYQGDKRVSSLPYSLALVANRDSADLNISSDVPVPSATVTPTRPESGPARDPSPPPSGTAATPPPPSSDTAARGPTAAAPPRPSPPLTSYSYRTAGTTIRCTASGGEAGEYQLSVSIDETSVVSADQAASAGAALNQLPVFRNLRSRNMVLLRDGQTRQYVVASDRVTGEVVRIDVTLRVVK